MKYSAQVHEPAGRKYEPELAPLDYPLHDETRPVYSSGSVSIPGQGKRHLTQALVGERIGLRELTPGNWLATFMDQDLGEFRSDTKRFMPW